MTKRIFLSMALATAGLRAAPLSWGDVASEALKNSPALASSRLEIKQAESAVTIAGASFWPSLNASAGSSRSGVTPLSAQPAFSLAGDEADRSSYQGALSASWNLFNGFGSSASREQSLKNLQSRKAAYVSASASLLLSLRQNFSQLLYAQKNEALLQNLAARYHQDMLYQELEFKSGRTPRWTYLKAQSDEAEIKWQTRQNSLNQEAARAALAGLCGRDLGSSDPISVQGELQALPPPDDDKGDLAKIASSHPAAIAARAQMEASQASLRLSQASRYPSLSASGSYGYSGVDNWGPSSQQWQAGLNLNFNLFSGGGQEAAISQADLGLQASRSDFQSQVIQLQAALHKAWAFYKSAYERLPISQMAADAGEERFRTVQKLYEAGRTAFLDYEQAESIYSQAQQQLLSSNLNAVQAQYSYENSTGMGLEEAMK